MNWETIAERKWEVICTCLKQRSTLEIAARQRETTFESLMAAAIVQMIREELYAAVASVLAFVLSLKRGDAPPMPQVDVPQTLRFAADAKPGSLNPTQGEG